MFKLKHIFLLSCFFVCNSTGLFPGVFGDNIVYLSNNKYSKVKDLKIGQEVTALNDEAVQGGRLLKDISGIKVTKNFLDKGILITLESKKKKKTVISAILVGSHQRFCVMKSRGDYAWVEAGKLRPGSRICEYDRRRKLIVKDVQRIKFKAKADLYEMSVDGPRTFYLVDTHGNRILTHNIGFLVGLLWFTAGSAVLGAVAGGCYVAYKSYRNEEKISSHAIARGVMVGACGGAAVGALVYTGFYFGPEGLPKIGAWLLKQGMKSEVIKPLIEAAQKNPKAASFIGESLCAFAGGALLYSTGILDNFLDETSRRENEDIDFSGIDIENRRPGNTLFNETLYDRNGNPIRISMTGMI